MTTDTSERGLERLICTALTGAPCDPALHGRRRARAAGRLRRRGWICGDAARLRPRVLRRPRPARAPSCSATQPEVGRGARPRRATARRGASSWPACRARSPSAASSTCCATASSTGRTTSTSSTARPRRATPRPPSASPPTASASPASCATAATRRSSRSTSASSSTACRSPPSS